MLNVEVIYYQVGNTSFVWDINQNTPDPSLIFVSWDDQEHLTRLWDWITMSVALLTMGLLLHLLGVLLMACCFK
jgi:hypothetical protein